MVVIALDSTYVISAYHHLRSEFESHSGEVYAIQHYNVCGKVCQWIEAGRWFSPGTPVSSTKKSTNKTDHHDITEILLKVALNTISQTLNHSTSILWSIVQGHNDVRVDLNLAWFHFKEICTDQIIIFLLGLIIN